IHTVGPKYPTENCQLNLAKCYIESLNLAKKNEIHSITFPLISTGKFSYPKKEACHIAVQTVKEWLKENSDYSMKVVFSCVDPTIYELIYSELNDKEEE
ncbi:MAG: macro domain-containing protein, partial [Clostridia bacterium]|nr:macro domain-containing protein [Clostridia bacterium]